MKSKLLLLILTISLFACGAKKKPQPTYKRVKPIEHKK